MDTKTDNIPFDTFCEELRDRLPKSTGAERAVWARAIVDNGWAVADFKPFLFEDQRISTRFLWMLSDLAVIGKEKLHKGLPFIWSHKDDLPKGCEATLANYWSLAGVPLENEGVVIDLLFDWLRSSKTNVTAKSRGAFVLFNLCQKYPDLKNELALSLEGEMGRHTGDFDTRAKKLLNKLRND